MNQNTRKTLSPDGRRTSAFLAADCLTQWTEFEHCQKKGICHNEWQRKTRAGKEFVNVEAAGESGACGHGMQIKNIPQKTQQLNHLSVCFLSFLLYKYSVVSSR